MSDILESVVHYTYLLAFILMIFCIKKYYSKDSNNIYFIGLGLFVFVFSLFLLKVFNGFYLYNSIIHGLGISIAVVLLVNFINNTENMNFNKPEIDLSSLMDSLKSPFSYLYDKLFNRTKVE